MPPTMRRWPPAPWPAPTSRPVGGSGRRRERTHALFMRGGRAAIHHLLPCRGGRFYAGAMRVLFAPDKLKGSPTAADLVVTGEGRLDAQAGAGKAPGDKAQLARAAGKPVIALAGSVPLTKGDHGGFTAVASVTSETMKLSHAMQHAGTLLEEAAARTAQGLGQGNPL